MSHVVNGLLVPDGETVTPEEAGRIVAAQNALVSAFLADDTPRSAAECYSDHRHDIATKGDCDYCHQTDYSA